MDEEFKTAIMTHPNFEKEAHLYAIEYDGLIEVARNYIVPIPGGYYRVSGISDF